MESLCQRMASMSSMNSATVPKEEEDRREIVNFLTLNNLSDNPGAIKKVCIINCYICMKIFLLTWRDCGNIICQISGNSFLTIFI